MTVHTAYPAELRLGPDAGSVRSARRVVAEAVGGAVGGERLDDLLLATSEVVTNAVEHGAPPVQLRVAAERERVRVEVQDGSPLPPRANDTVAPSEIRGRGLAIVERCTDRWGVEPVGEGKSVWFELDLRDR